jgi:hypothetical protein
MFKKIARDFTIIFCFSILWASTSRPFMAFISQVRDNAKWWGGYPCLHGDLVSMSYLDFVEEFKPNDNDIRLKKRAGKMPKNTVLYLHGDSNGWNISDSNLETVSQYYFIGRRGLGEFDLDTAKRNVLIIESAERCIRDFFETPEMLGQIKFEKTKKKEASLFSNAKDKNNKLSAAFPDPLSIVGLFNKNINQNLQCNLFNYNVLMPMFEGKAALNYYFFNRASGDVVISDDRKFLFLKETVDKTDSGSSYCEIKPEVVKQIVAILNEIYDHYKNSGLDEIYFSAIPNTASIMQPDGYNNLIPLIQNDPDLRMPVIDVYTKIKNSKENCFYTGDAHWNNTGKQKWIDMINERLMSGVDFKKTVTNN